MKKSELRNIIKEEIKKVIKEARYPSGSPILPLGKVNIKTGGSSMFNIYDVWLEDGDRMHFEIWKTYDNKYKAIFGSGNSAYEKVGTRSDFYHDQNFRPFGSWTLVDSGKLKDFKNVTKYGNSISGYVYK